MQDTLNSRAYFVGARPEIAKLMPQTFRRVLEIGCGEGGFRASVTRDCEYWGIEPDALAAERAASRLDQVLTGTYDAVSARLPEHHFDVVICNDVIEHMPDHDRFLAEVQTRMTPGAHLVGSVPNVRYIDNLIRLLVLRDWEYRGEGVLDRTHLRFFTERSFRRAMHAAGLELEHFAGINLCPDFARRALARGIGIATLGSHDDVRYMQFAFRARRPG